MPTFNELMNEYQGAKNKKCVLMYLVEYLDTNFRTNAGAEPKQKLLNDDKIPVPESSIEAVVAEILTAELEQLTARIAQIEQSNIAPPAAPTQQN